MQSGKASLAGVRLMCRRWLLVLVAAALVGTAGSARAQGKPTLADKVQRSIGKGTSYLFSKQGPEGDWEGSAGYQTNSGGASALVTLALLNAGVREVDRPKVEK